MKKETELIDPVERVSGLMPPGAELAAIIKLLRTGQKFLAQQRGRKAGFLRNHLAAIMKRDPAPGNFEEMLEQLELDAVRRDRDGESAGPVHRVDRVWELVTYQHPKKKCEVKATFKTLRNIFTDCRKP